MGNYNKGNKFGGRKGGKKFGGFRGERNGGRPEMHKTVCSDCGNDCEVPFRPTGNKPVFCSGCFRNKGSNDSRNFRDRGNRNSQSRFGDKQPHQQNTENYKAQLEQVNAKLDKILGVLIPEVSSEKTKETKVSKPKKVDKKSITKKPKVKKSISKKKKK